MYCPHCGHDGSKVIDSRDSGGGVRRRRECALCGQRFTTYERVQTRSLQVIKRDGRREEFDREKLWASLTKACAKRPLPTGSIQKAVDDIEAQLAEVGRLEVPAKGIGEMVIERLKKMDRVAYIRFASVYRDFRDIETFKEEIDALLKPSASQTTPRVPSNQLTFLEDEEVMPVPPRRGRPRRSPTAPS